MSYARNDWSITAVFISGYANTVVTSQNVSQSYFIKEIENGRPVFISVGTSLYLININVSKELWKD